MATAAAAKVPASAQVAHEDLTDAEWAERLSYIAGWIAVHSRQVFQLSEPKFFRYLYGLLYQVAQTTNINLYGPNVNANRNAAAPGILAPKAVRVAHEPALAPPSPDAKTRPSALDRAQADEAPRAQLTQLPAAAEAPKAQVTQLPAAAEAPRAQVTQLRAGAGTNISNSDLMESAKSGEVEAAAQAEGQVLAEGKMWAEGKLWAEHLADGGEGGAGEIVCARADGRMVGPSVGEGFAGVVGAGAGGAGIDLSGLSISDLFRLDFSKLQVFTKACTNDCSDPKCVRIHGQFESEQALEFKRAEQSGFRYGFMVCRDDLIDRHMLGTGICTRHACGFRHYHSLRGGFPTTHQVVAVLLCYWKRPSRLHPGADHNPFPAQPPRFFPDSSGRVLQSAREMHAHPHAPHLFQRAQEHHPPHPPHPNVHMMGAVPGAHPPHPHLQMGVGPETRPPHPQAHLMGAGPGAHPPHPHVHDGQRLAPRAALRQHRPPPIATRPIFAPDKNY